MKLRLGDTVIETNNIAYAIKRYDHIVEIYFIGLSEPLKVFCGKEQTERARFLGNTNELLARIEDLDKSIQSRIHTVESSMR